LAGQSGGFIFKEIETLQNEYTELNRALSDLDDDTLPYRLLKEAATKKWEELNAAKNRRWYTEE
jgi:hypothetical protein